MRKIKIPLELIRLEDESWHLMALAEINGKDCHVLLDTGASHTVFDLQYLSRETASGGLSVESCGKQVTGLHAGLIENLSGILDRFSLGGLVLEDFPAVFIDFSEMNGLYRQHADREISGLIGSDFFLKYKALICYNTLCLTLKIPDLPSPEPQGAESGFNQ